MGQMWTRASREQEGGREDGGVVEYALLLTGIVGFIAAAIYLWGATLGLS